MSRTLWIVVLTFAGLVVYDVWTIVRYGYDTTISAVLYDFSRDYPIVSFGLGIIFGHLYFPSEHACKRLAEKKKAE